MDIVRKKETVEDKSQMSLNINFQNELLCRFESSLGPHIMAGHFTSNITLYLKAAYTWG